MLQGQTLALQEEALALQGQTLPLQEEAQAQQEGQALAQQGGQALALQGGRLILFSKYLSVFSFSTSFLFIQAR